MSNAKKTTNARRKAAASRPEKLKTHKLRITQARVDKVGIAENDLLAQSTMQMQAEYMERRVILLRAELDLVYEFLQAQGIDISIITQGNDPDEAQSDEEVDGESTD